MLVRLAVITWVEKATILPRWVEEHVCVTQKTIVQGWVCNLRYPLSNITIYRLRKWHTRRFFKFFRQMLCPFFGAPSLRIHALTFGELANNFGDLLVVHTHSSIGGLREEAKSLLWEERMDRFRVPAVHECRCPSVLSTV